MALSKIQKTNSFYKFLRFRMGCSGVYSGILNTPAKPKSKIAKKQNTQRLGYGVVAMTGIKRHVNDMSYALMRKTTWGISYLIISRLSNL